MSTAAERGRGAHGAGIGLWCAGAPSVYHAREIPDGLTRVQRSIVASLLRGPSSTWALAKVAGAESSEVDNALVSLTMKIGNLCEADDGRMALANRRRDGIIGIDAEWRPGQYGPARQLALALSLAGILLTGCAGGASERAAAGTPDIGVAYIPVAVGWPAPLSPRTPTPKPTRAATSRDTLIASVKGFARTRGVDGAGTRGASCVVRSLEWSGAGTLADCLSRPGHWITFAERGRLTMRGDLAVPSNTTIDARGAGVQLWGGGLTIRRSQNVIIAGLAITECDEDAIQISEHAAGVYMEGLDLSSCHDGLVDITDGATDITLAGSTLRDHAKGMLIGASDGHASDAAIRVTITNVIMATTYRHPMCRYGYVHLDRVTVGPWRGDAVDARYGCRVLITRSRFTPGGKEAGAAAARFTVASAPGAIRIDDATDLGGQWAEVGGAVPDPVYGVIR